MPTEADWQKFVGITSGRPPWPRLVRAAALFESPGDALDVGAGGGRDTAHLLRAGWRVTAVDASAASATALRRMPRQRNLQVVKRPAQDFTPETYDLVNAQFSLPFIPPAHFMATVERLRDAVLPGGVMACTFFGKNDEWNVPGDDRTFVTEATVKRLFRGWKFLELAEIEEDGNTADGTPKHWHVYHVIARRPGGAPARPGPRATLGG